MTNSATGAVSICALLAVLPVLGDKIDIDDLEIVIAERRM